MHVSNRGVGVSTGAGPFSAWTSARYPRINRITVGGTAGTRYLVEAAYDLRAVEMASVAGMDALALAPTGADDLVNQLNAADKFSRWVLLAALSALLLVVGATSISDGTVATGVVTLLIAALVSGLGVILYRKESIEHLVPVQYTLEGALPGWAAKMEATWAALQQLEGSWRIVESGRVQTLYQHKTNAGASHLINRVGAAFSTAPPKVLVANITVPSINSGSTTLYFLADRILVRTGRKWSDVTYSHLRVDVHHQRFIEESPPPRDARQVGTTWKYVNKGGGPDRRFKDNRQLPVMLYGRVTLASAEGLSWILDLSRTDVADQLASCLRAHPA